MGNRLKTLPGNPPAGGDMNRIRVRVLGWLLANFLANAVLVYGLVRYLDGRPATAILLVGAAASLACMLVLARPHRL